MQTSGLADGLRLAIAGGGTGGHVLPALAVVEELRRQTELEDVVWIGSQDGIEREAAQKAGIRFVPIPTGKLRRYVSLHNVIDATRMPLGLIAARRALRRARPHAVLSTGGYVSVPTVIAARGIAPVVTHEQTAILGMATRIDARFAKVLAISHKQTEAEARRIHRHVAVTGNPVRLELATGDRGRGLAQLGFSEQLPMVFATGGARGASVLNQRIGELVPDLLQHTQILQQTGPASANADAAALRAMRNSFPEPIRRRYAVVEFVGDELPDVYAAADLVVGRAGAGTVAELAFIGKPAVLIPLPGAGGDEQAVNARVLGDAGAAVVLPQHEATSQRLREVLLGLLGDPVRRVRMADAARSVAQPDAAARLAEIVSAIARDNQSASHRQP